MEELENLLHPHLSPEELALFRRRLILGGRYAFFRTSDVSMELDREAV